MKNLNQIIKQKEAAESKLFKFKGVTGVDVGYKYTNGKRTDEVTIRVHVKEKKKNVAVKDRIPSEINGIKTDVIEMEIITQIASLVLDDIAIQADTTTYSTIKGGISIGPERTFSTPDGNVVYTGTLGCVAKDNVTNNPVLLSNFHVMCVDDSWSVGDHMCQPSRVDTGSPVTDRIGELHRAVLSSNVDGAISTLNGRPSSCEIVDIGDVKGTANAVLNAPVRKRGRTTLFTKGFVDAINATVRLDYGDGIGVRMLTNQIGIRPDTSSNPRFSDRGDSGSVVVNDDNKIIGLLFAGARDGSATYINPISHVLSELNISICTNTKSFIKDFKDSRKDKLEKVERKELKVEKLEKVEQKEHFKDFKETRKELKEGRKEFKEIFEDKRVPDVGKPITDKLDKPYENKLRENVFNPPIAGGQNDTSLEQRMASLEQMMSTLTAYISQDLRPDLSQGALTSEEDIHAAQQKMNKDVADSMGY